MKTNHLRPAIPAGRIVSLKGKKMDTKDYSKAILEELKKVMEQVSPDACTRLCGAITNAARVFVAGAGRSGLAAKAFAMRLMHLGCDAYVCGEMVTPSFRKGDLLLIVSGSGETASLTAMAAKAHAVGGALALVTVRAESSIGSMAEVIVPVPAPTPKADNAFHSVQPMGALFEQSCFLLLDAVVMELMEQLGQDEASMYARHANLE